MLDINFIKANPQKVKDACKNKGYEIDVDYLLQLENELKSLQKELELKRQIRNLETELYKELMPLIKSGIIKIEDGVVYENN